jgi:hypothetical protein
MTRVDARRARDLKLFSSRVFRVVRVPSRAFRRARRRVERDGGSV